MHLFIASGHWFDPHRDGPVIPGGTGTIDIHYTLMCNAKSKRSWSWDRNCATPTQNTVLIIPAVEYAHDHSFRHGFHGGAQPTDVASVLGIGR